MAIVRYALFVLFVLLLFLPDTLAQHVTVPFRNHLTVRSLNKRSDASSSLSKTFDTASVDLCGDVLSFYCPSNEQCYTGANGYIGCCSVSKCLARTCIDYTSAFSPNCDYSTGGCWYCSDSSSPYCATVTDIVASQFINFCRATPVHSTLIYTSLGVSGSSGASPGSTTSDQPRRTIFGQSVSSSYTTPPATSGSTTGASISDNMSRPTSFSSTITPQVAVQQPSSTTDNPVSAASSSSDSNNSPSSLSSSPGMIAGMVIGSAGGTVLILLLLYLIRKRINRRREAAASAAASTTSKLNHAYEHGDGPSAQSTLIGENTSAANSPPHSPAEIGASTTEEKRTSYRVLNPDAHSTTKSLRSTNACVPDFSISAVPGRVEAPTDRLVQKPHELHVEPMSPAVSTLTDPFSSPASTFKPSPLLPSPITPRTPNRYTSGQANPSTPRVGYAAYSPSVYGKDGMPPSSLPREATGMGAGREERQGRGQPPSGLQSYSSLPFVHKDGAVKQKNPQGHDQASGELQTSMSLPSMYAGDEMPTSSLTKATEAPSGLLRCPSLAELEGDSPIERGRGRDEPWKYLSAENALAGGWKNENV